MRILVVGAGAVGGYFGGRLLEKGEDVSILIREKRQKQLQEHGIQIESIHGNVTLRPRTIISGDEAGLFDLIILSTKGKRHQNSIVRDHLFKLKSLPSTKRINVEKGSVFGTAFSAFNILKAYDTPTISKILPLSKKYCH